MPLIFLLVTGCGGGSNGSSTPSSTSALAGNTIASVAPNVQPIVVDAGPAANGTNSLFTSVTICSPGNSSNCQTIDHVLVDTGSSGLRIMASVLPSSFVLPQQADSTGNAYAECAQFVDGYTWGPVKIADVKIANERALSVPIQLIGDPAFSVVPNSCSDTGPAENTVASFGANGVLGVGVAKQDCGNFCAASATPGSYYVCSGSSCSETAQALVLQVQNPVWMFANDNNGVIIELPAISSEGAASVNGVLVFGIGTQSNNGLGAAQVFTVDPNTGAVATLFNNTLYSDSLFDTGSTAFYFSGQTIPVCGQQDFYTPGFYCPSSTLHYTASIRGTNDASSVIPFDIANAHDLVSSHPGYTAFNNIASPIGHRGSFIWGLPAFFGRNVFMAIEGQNTSVGAGPYFAF